MIAPDINLVAELFSEAARLPSDERAEFLDRRCAGDLALRDKVMRLLHFHEQSSVFDKPVLGSMLHSPDGCDVSGSDQRIDKYRLVKTIGAGLNSVVYLAEQDEPVKRSVALKVLRWHDGDGRSRARFRLEQQALALLNHPSIVPILESGATADGQPFFVMRFVDGAPITTFCEQHGLSRRERLCLFLDVTDAVHSAHLQGVHHRDLKPSNVLVEPCEPHARIALIDLGIARIEASPGATIGANTMPGQLVGSLAYMAPARRPGGRVLARLPALRAACARPSLSRNARRIVLESDRTPKGDPAALARTRKAGGQAPRGDRRPCPRSGAGSALRIGRESFRRHPGVSR
jgi:serine/threonine protein kinase